MRPFRIVRMCGAFRMLDRLILQNHSGNMTCPPPRNHPVGLAWPAAPARLSSSRPALIRCKFRLGHSSELAAARAAPCILLVRGAAWAGAAQAPNRHGLIAPPPATPSMTVPSLVVVCAYAGISQPLDFLRGSSSRSKSSSSLARSFMYHSRTSSSSSSSSSCCCSSCC